MFGNLEKVNEVKAQNKLLWIGMGALGAIALYLVIQREKERHERQRTQRTLDRTRLLNRMAETTDETL